MTFLKYLDTLRVSESFRSVWIFAESSYKIFEYAKKRVYRFGRSDGAKPSGQGKSVTGKKRKSKGDDKNEKEGEWLLLFLLFCFALASMCIVLLHFSLNFNFVIKDIKKKLRGQVKRRNSGPLVSSCEPFFFLFLFNSYSFNEYVAVGSASSASTSSGLVLEEVLEEAPKWKVLRVSE